MLIVNKMQKENEQYGLKSLLSGLSVNELTQLLGTVTNNMLKLDGECEEELINAIILHSPSTNSILNRKIVTCAILCNYLHKNSVSVFPPVTKAKLIELVLNHWRENNENDDTASTKNQRDLTCNIDHDSHSENKTELSIVQADTEQSIKSQDTVNFPINIMARTFCEWFYKMFNEENGLTTSHFWPDCSLKLHLKSGEDVHLQEILNNAEDVVNLLDETRSLHNLFFNPNISHDGVQGRMNSYGLSLIVVCGTLHRENLCVGVFQQMFALARDPQAENNWKIKNIELKLHNTNVTNIPSLNESDYKENILSLPENEEFD